MGVDPKWAHYFLRVSLFFYGSSSLEKTVYRNGVILTETLAANARVEVPRICIAQDLNRGYLADIGDVRLGKIKWRKQFSTDSSQIPLFYIPSVLSRYRNRALQRKQRLFLNHKITVTSVMRPPFFFNASSISWLTWRLFQKAKLALSIVGRKVPSDRPVPSIYETNRRKKNEKKSEHRTEYAFTGHEPTFSKEARTATNETLATS